MMSTGIFGIGVSGIRAAQVGLLTTDHNITNANTAGYSRQRGVQSASMPLYTGYGSLGQGTDVQTVERAYDRFLVQQINNDQTRVSELDVFDTSISQIDNLLADPSAGLTPALQSYFSSVQTVANNPSDPAARQAMMSSAQVLVGRFQTLDGQLKELQDSINEKLQIKADEINSIAEQIAGLNQRIIAAQGQFNQPANDLLDERDQLVNDLSKLVKINQIPEDDGSYSIYLSSGQTLVSSAQSIPVTAVASAADPERMVLAQVLRSGPMELPEELVTGGEVGGLLSFRREALEPAVNALGRLSVSMALSFNAQHALGQNQYGYVSPANGETAAAPNYQADFFTFANSLVAKANDRNTGTASVTASFAPAAAPAPPYTGSFTVPLEASDYLVQFDATGATFSVTRMSDRQIMVAAGTPSATPFALDGINVVVNGAAGGGDSFLLQPYADTVNTLSLNANIVADPRLINTAGPVRTAAAAANRGNMAMTQGVVGNGFSVAGLPATIAVSNPGTGLELSGVPAGATAVYADGSSSTVAGNVPFISGTSNLVRLDFSGMSFGVSGTPVANDTFTISRNAQGTADSRNALALAKLQTSKVMNGEATYQDAYARLVADTGIKASEAKAQLQAQTSILEYAQTARDNLSAVNLDEEAANMIRFQQAYQASAKILEVGKTLFDTLLQIR